VRIPLPDPVRAAIDALRMRWNPEVATGNPAHVTVVYHDEAPDAALLRARLERACRLVERFRLELGSVRRFPAPASGAFVQVVDPAGGVERLRRDVLAPPFSQRARFGLHVTLLHPAQGGRLDEAWPHLAPFRAAASFVAERVELIAGERGATETLATLELGGRTAPAG
jgi:hypothetical protein